MKKNSEPRANILVVEDELIIAKGIEKRLLTLGYNVVGTVQTGESAVEKAIEMLPDLVLMDICLQGEMDGITAAQKIAMEADIPVIYLTAYADSDTLERAKVTEPFGYIVKPFQDITLKSAIEMALYKHRMEKKLRHNEQWLATILRSIGDAVIATDIAGSITYMNQLAEELTGWVGKDAIGRPLAEVFCVRGEENVPSVDSIVSKVVRNGAAITFFGRTVLLSRDGREIPIEAKATPFAGVQGSNMGLALVFLDITERVRVEEALRHSERQLRSVFKAVPDLISILDKDLRIILSNWGGGYDYVPEELRQCNPFCYKAYYGTDKPCEECHAKEVFKTGKLAYREKINPHIGTVEIYSTPIFDESGNIAYVVETVRDITRRKKAEEALAAEKERLAVTLRSIGDGVITTDFDGKILLLNRAAEEMTGWRQEEAVGKPFGEVFNIINEKTRKPPQNPVVRVLSTGISVEIENQTILISRDGRERVIADSGAPIRDQQSRIIGAVVVFRDITEKRKMEQELLKAQHMESIGVLAGGIAHDFNNLLTAILGNISLAKIMAPKGEKIHLKLIEAENASIRARDLTQQLLTFSRGGAPVKKATCIADIIKDSASFTLSGSRTNCCFDIESGLWPVEVDSGQISQVINNLIINADQAMPGGGVIDVICRNVLVEDDDRLPVRYGRYITVTIRDHGIGIPPESLERIFEPYFTTKKTGKGLGLATVYSIVKNHNGHIVVSSKEGEGTTFTLYLPCGDGIGELLPKETAVLDENSPADFSGKVLVMDDEKNIRDVAGEMLDFLGYEAEFASDGIEAVELFKTRFGSSEPFVAVLLDLTVQGGMGGKEAVELLKEIDPDVKVIASSGYSNDPILADHKIYGFSGIISKPYQLSDLKQVLVQVLGGSSG